MFDSKKELLDKIRLGEDSFLELKEARFSGARVTKPHRDSLADELATFANSRGASSSWGWKMTHTRYWVFPQIVSTMWNDLSMSCATTRSIHP